MGLSKFLFIYLLTVLMSAAPALAADSNISAAYLFNLSDFDGTIPYNGARTFTDDTRNEIYVVATGGVDIYNASGMQVYHFDYDRELGGVFDAAVDEKGDILLLTFRDGAYRIAHCNYRGEPVSSVDLKFLPTEFEGFIPNRMVYHEGLIYLANQAEMRAIVVDMAGNFVRGYDFAVILNLSDQSRADAGIGGFTVDKNGNMLFTISTFGHAYRCSLNGEILEIGKRGSGPGKFGVPFGIASDKSGNLLVTDKLRCVVLIFDKELRFVKEFGVRGLRPGNLIVPNEISVDAVANRAYVSQMRRRGVNIYQLTYE